MQIGISLGLGSAIYNQGGSGGDGLTDLALTAATFNNNNTPDATWNAATGQMVNTSAGTQATFPRLIFGGILTIGESYRVVVTTTGTQALNRAGRGEFVSAVAGQVDGPFVAAAADLQVHFDGTGTFDLTVTRVAYAPA